MGIDTFLSNAAKSVGSVAGDVGGGFATVGKGIGTGVAAGAGAVSDLVAKAGNAIHGVPILGPILGVYTPLNWVTTANNILRGERIDKAALSHLKTTVKDYKAVAPYVASVISFVPGVGTGVSSGIMAAGALAEGQPLSEVAIQAAKGSIPGGPIAQIAFNIAESAIKGQPIDQMAINALPINETAKQAIRTGVNLAKDLANGKQLDDALLARVDDGIKLVSPAIGSALTTGISMGLAQVMQKEVVKQITSPKAQEILRSIGNDIASISEVAKAARFINTSPQFQRGFDIGIGMMNGKIGDLNALTALRNSLDAETRKGFDTAAALQIGQAKKLGRQLAPVKKLGKAQLESEKIKASLVTALKQVPPNQKAIAVLNTKLGKALEAEKSAQLAKAQVSEVEKIKASLVNALKQMPPNQKMIAVLNEKLKKAIATEGAKTAGTTTAVAVSANQATVAPAQMAGFLVTQGLVGADDKQKVAIVTDIASNPTTRTGAADAIKEIAAERSADESLLDKILKFFGLG